MTTSVATTPSIAPEVDSDERSRLIQQLGDAVCIQVVDLATHSMLWLSDIEVLRHLLRKAQSGVEGARNVFSHLSNPERVMRNLQSWLASPQRPGDDDIDGEPELSPPGSPTPAESPHAPRKHKFEGETSSPSKIPRLSEPSAGQDLTELSDIAKETAYERDDGLCIVTKMGEPVEACHIYPFAMGVQSLQERTNFWFLLGVFWPLETIAKWKEHISGPDGTEVVNNLLCLSSTVHELWGKARFALEPVGMSEDKTSLTMRFWWLPLRTYSKQVRLTDAPSLPSDLDAGPFNAKLWDCETEERIRSGHLLTMTTPDPESMPLPSFELLRMQWTLNRVAALCGAADVSEEDYTEDFEDDFQCSCVR